MKPRHLDADLIELELGETERSAELDVHPRGPSPAGRDDERTVLTGPTKEVRELFQVLPILVPGEEDRPADRHDHRFPRGGARGRHAPEGGPLGFIRVGARRRRVE